MGSELVSAPSGHVSFLIAGVQKAGTTTLWEHLRRVQGLYLPENKEPHFFDNEDVDWTAPNIERYHRLFVQSPEGARWGEATPIYIFWPQALERIRAYNPTMKLILVFRDPIERAVSHWRMEKTRAWETRELGEALRAGADWPTSAATAEQKLRRFSYVERGLYGQQLEKALSLFPREQMLLLTSDALWSNAARTIRRIAHFLEVESPREVAGLRAFEGQGPAASLSQADLAFLRERLAPDLARFAEMSGLDLTGWPTLSARAKV